MERENKGGRSWGKATPTCWAPLYRCSGGVAGGGFKCSAAKCLAPCGIEPWCGLCSSSESTNFSLALTHHSRLSRFSERARGICRVSFSDRSERRYGSSLSTLSLRAPTFVDLFSVLPHTNSLGFLSLPLFLLSLFNTSSCNRYILSVSIFHSHPLRSHPSLEFTPLVILLQW